MTTPDIHHNPNTHCPNNTMQNDFFPKDDLDEPLTAPHHTALTDQTPPSRRPPNLKPLRWLTLLLLTPLLLLAAGSILEELFLYTPSSTLHAITLRWGLSLKARRQAAQKLYRLGKKASPHAHSLTQTLHPQLDSITCNLILHSLRNITGWTPTTPHTLQRIALKREDHCGYLALQLLLQRSPILTRPLLHQLLLALHDHKHPHNQIESANKISKFGPLAIHTIPQLCKTLQSSPNQQLKRTLINTLGLIHTTPQLVIPLLQTYLLHPALKRDAFVAITRFGPSATNAIPHLLHTLKNEPHTLNQKTMLRSLAHLGRHASSTSPFLTTLTRQPGPLQFQAALSLAHIDPNKARQVALPVLIHAAQTLTLWWWRQQAIQAIQLLSPLPHNTLPLLQKLSTRETHPLVKKELQHLLLTPTTQQTHKKRPPDTQK